MDANLTKSQADSVFTSLPCFEAVLQQWAKARMDTPLQIVARFDEAAKQLIAIGGILQGLFIAVFAFSTVSPRISVWGIFIIVFLILAFIFCAAKVICTLPPEMEAMGAYDLFKKIGTSSVSDVELAEAVKKWCIGIEQLTEKKHKWLRAANMLFILSSFAALLLVLWGMR